MFQFRDIAVFIKTDMKNRDAEKDFFAAIAEIPDEDAGQIFKNICIAMLDGVPHTMKWAFDDAEEVKR